MITALRPPRGATLEGTLAVVHAPRSSRGGVAPVGSGMRWTVSKLSQTSSRRRSPQQSLDHRLRALFGSRRAKSGRRPADRSRRQRRRGRSDATPGSKECKITQSGSSTPPVSRHHRPNAFASSVLPVPPGPCRTTTRWSRAGDLQLVEQPVAAHERRPPAPAHRAVLRRWPLAQAIELSIERALFARGLSAGAGNGPRGAA